ncbi:hypothetical protein L5I01_31205 [Gordonia sp. HY442]|uniref:hypothetical protein n=1 Tax=Gordonia zhenghanii TaxID=2911516 RepID=UPI001F45FA30|nr:hypothetical protein [Gordonia zhenghanii]MCF8607833.1 hypothetical protein [Gordonia zhenghanii]
MRKNTSPTLTSTLRGYSRRINKMMTMNNSDRVALQLSNSPVAVLGPTPRRR